MGCRWEVESWQLQPNGDWGYTSVHRGQSLIAAVRALWREKKVHGVGCVTLSWRG
jgi:hypothetical protein